MSYTFTDHNECIDCHHEDVTIISHIIGKDFIKVNVVCNDCNKQGEDTFEVDACSIAFERISMEVRNNWN